MTARQWLRRERLPHYSGINARRTLRNMIPLSPPAHAYFHTAIGMRDRDIRNALFRVARDERRWSAMESAR